MTKYVAGLDATNLPPGDDGNTGGIGDPLLTLSAALSARSANEDVVIDGTINDTAQHSGPGAGDQLRILPYVDLQATLNHSGSQGYMFNFASATDAELYLGAIKVNAANCTTGLGTISGSNACALTCVGTQVVDLPSWGWFNTATNIDYTFTDVDISLSKSGELFNAWLYAVSVASGSLTIKNLTFDIIASVTNAERGLILFDASAAGVTCSIRGFGGTYEQTHATSSLHLLNIADVKNCIIDGENRTINLRNSGSGSMSVSRIAPSTAQGLDSSNAVIKNYKANYITATGGIVALIGRDGANATADDQCNDGLIKNIITTGPGVSNSIHGPMLGNNLRGVIEGCQSTGLNISFLMKNQNGGHGTGLIAINPDGQGLRFKGADTCTYSNSQVVMGVDGGYAMFADDDSADSTNCNFINNDVWLKSGTSPDGINYVNVGSDAEFANNNYYLQGTISSGDFHYDGTNYTDLDAWVAAQEGTATENSTSQRSLSTSSSSGLSTLITG